MWVYVLVHIHGMYLERNFKTANSYCLWREKIGGWWAEVRGNFPKALEISFEVQNTNHIIYLKEKK